MRTFVPVYRYDPLYRFVLRRLMPMIVWLTAAAALIVPVLLLASVWADAPAAGRGRLLMLVAALAGLLLTAALLFGWVSRRLRREALDTEWTLERKGFSRRAGARTVRRSWDQLLALGTVGVGRLQLARVRCAAGNLWFDASYVEALDPPPRLRRGAWKFFIEYPDGSRRPLEIEQSELYQALRAGLGELR